MLARFGCPVLSERLSWCATTFSLIYRFLQLRFGSFDDDISSEVWELNGQSAKRIDVSGFSGMSQFQLMAGETFVEVLKRNFPARFCLGLERQVAFEHWRPWEPHELQLKPGQYYPRIARPSCANLEDNAMCPDFAKYKNSFSSLAGQLATLIRQLLHICEVVHPRDANLQAYGDEIRNLLILACTEAEAHWRGVLEANMPSVKSTRWSTNDYVKLLEPLYLKSYQISFPSYPWLAPIRPFATWDSAEPTASLKWYHAYNAVKHDRENNFKDAQLEHAFHAVAACAVMLYAQFGKATSDWHPVLQLLQLEEAPDWPISGHYIPPYGSAASGWTPINYPF